MKITALLLIVTMLVTLCLCSCNNGSDTTDSFDYLTSDLSKYIELNPEEYKNFNLQLQIMEPDYESEVNNLMLSILSSAKGSALTENTEGRPIGAGDVVNIRYRGYLFDENGEIVEYENMTNLGGSTTALTVGSMNFVQGFELSLIGLVPTDYPKFVKITEGKVTDLSENGVVYVNYSVTEGTSSVSKSGIRIELSSDIDKKYGAGFEEMLKKLTVGGEGCGFSVDLNGETLTYADLKVVFATECEVDPFTIKVRFPYNYGNEDLNNKEAFFEIYIDSVSYYETATLTDELLKDLITNGKIVADIATVETYAGDNFIEKFREYAKSVAKKSYEEDLVECFNEAVIEHFVNSGKVIEYPESKIKDIELKYQSLIVEEYNSNEGYVYDYSIGQYKYCNEFDDFANTYLGLSGKDGNTWQAFVNAEAKEYVKEQLVIYYILRNESLIPSNEKVAELVANKKSTLFDAYVQDYLDYYGYERSDFITSEWYELITALETEYFGYYSNEYFTELVYYEFLTDAAANWGSYNTLKRN